MFLGSLYCQNLTCVDQLQISAKFGIVCFGTEAIVLVVYLSAKWWNETLHTITMLFPVVLVHVMVIFGLFLTIQIKLFSFVGDCSYILKCTTLSYCGYRCILSITVRFNAINVKLVSVMFCFRKHRCYGLMWIDKTKNPLETMM